MTEPSGPIRVVLVDDHQMLTETLTEVLRLEPLIEVVGAGSNAAEAVRLVGEMQPDVVVLDYHLPDGTPAEVAPRLLEACPSARVMILSGMGDERSLISAFDAGCIGFVTKDKAVDELVTAIRQVHAGQAYVPASMLGALIPRVGRREERLGDDLSTREREVLERLCRGMSSAAIAAELFLSVHTVRNHIQGILTRLHVHSKLEAVAVATREGFFRNPGSL